MIILFKLEVTLAIIILALFAMCWLAAKGCESSQERKLKQLAQNLGTYCMFLLIILCVLMAITAVWAFI